MESDERRAGQRALEVDRRWRYLDRHLIQSGPAERIVWSVLEPLMRDPEPDQKNEIMGSGFLGDPATSSINMVRGLAMHATVRYALWVKRLSDDSTWMGFNEIPEVLAVLEDHLNIAAEATRTVRAVYGQWFPWIVFLDPEWAKNYVSSIFPDGEELEYLRDAAWNTYLTVSRAYDNNTFDLLRTQYLQAIDRIEPLDPEGYPYNHPDKRLAERLMVFFWRAKIEFGDSDQLIERFFEKATDDLKGKALGFVGRTAENYEGRIPDDTVRRLTALWERRISSIFESSDLENHNKELASFGWWFMSSQFDDGWAIDQLLGVLESIKEVEADGHVVQRLAELSDSHSFKAVHALRLMAEGDEDGWGMGLWRDDARLVLEHALSSSDGSAKREAVNLIHYMASRNDRQFVDLLSQSS